MSTAASSAHAAATWPEVRIHALTRAAGRCEECQVNDGATLLGSSGPYTVVLQVLPYLDPNARALCQACAMRLWITGAQLAGRPV